MPFVIVKMKGFLLDVVGKVRAPHAAARVGINPSDGSMRVACREGPGTDEFIVGRLCDRGFFNGGGFSPRAGEVKGMR